ncbi:MAG: DUF58 domain-containing protein [Actinobacteria bacterium]|nr:DUF58 domain-containing protein [Actinomycetota bacterium]
MFFSRSIMVLILSFSMILIGVNSQSGWMFWFASLLIAALCVSWSISLFQVRKLSLVRRHLQEIDEEDTLRVTLEIHNRGLFSRNLLEVLDEDPVEGNLHKRLRLISKRKPLREQMRDPSPPEKESPADVGGRASFLITRIDGGGEASFSYLRGKLRRGVYENWPGYFYSEGILGLARHSSRLEVESQLTVLPHYEELGSFPLVDSFLHHQKTSQEYSCKKGVGIDYYGVREFRSGDPLRHVHWKTTARRGELVVREFEQETGTPLVVLIDNRAGGDDHKHYRVLLDAEARLAASVVHYAHYAGHPVTLAAYRGERPDLYDVKSFHDALRWLAALEPVGGAGLVQQAEGLWPELSPGCFFCCITPARGMDCRRIASALPYMCHVALVLVDPLSYNGNGSSHLAASPEQVLSGLIETPFPGLFSISLHRKEESLRVCLEKPLIIYGESTPRGR